MGTIVTEKKKSGVLRYRAEVRKEGQRITKRFPNRSLAKRWIARTEVGILEGSFTPAYKKHSMAEVIDRYISEVLPQKKADTQSLHRAQLEWFKGRVGSLKLHQLDSSILVNLREELRTQPVQKPNSSKIFHRAPATINRYFVPLSHALRIASKDWKWIQIVPAYPKLKEPKGRTRYLTPNEARSVLEFLERDPERRDVFLACKISFTYGSRLRETCALKWIDVDFDNQILTFRETKNGADKGVPLTKGLESQLMDWRLSRNSEFLFPASRTDSLLGYIYDKVQKGFRRACKSLGIVGATYHSSRHTVGTWATKAGVNRPKVAGVLGHKDFRTTDRYTHLDVHDLRPVVTLIEGILEEPKCADGYDA